MDSSQPRTTEALAPHVEVPTVRNSFWRKLGGGSLTVSILVHAAILAVGVFWIVQYLPQKNEEPVDFMPRGGGGGSPGAKSDTAQRKRATMTPMNAPRVVARGAEGTMTLPEPEAATAISAIGSLGGAALGGGLGGSGSGGGRGDGNGTGFGSGSGPGLGGNAIGAKPFAGIMFGNQIKARTIGVVLDVSGSMSGHLPRVIKELDRVAEGSPLVLYVGCGIGPGRPETKAYSTTDIDPKRFERFWRLSHESVYGNPTVSKGSSRVKVDFTTPIPAENLYRQLAKRPNTFYIDYDGVQFAWTALLSKELRDSEAVYWFSDFQDAVDDDEAKDVMRRLRSRKQKLYMHASGNGRSSSKVQELMVQPTGGSVIESK